MIIFPSQFQIKHQLLQTLTELKRIPYLQVPPKFQIKYQLLKALTELKCIPYLQVLCKDNEYFHLHSVCAQLQYKVPFLSTSFQANALEQVRQPCQAMPKVHLAPEGEGNISPPAKDNYFKQHKVKFHPKKIQEK